MGIHVLVLLGLYNYGHYYQIKIYLVNSFCCFNNLLPIITSDLLYYYKSSNYDQFIVYSIFVLVL